MFERSGVRSVFCSAWKIKVATVTDTNIDACNCETEKEIMNRTECIPEKLFCCCWGVGRDYRYFKRDKELPFTLLGK